MSLSHRALFLLLPLFTLPLDGLAMALGQAQVNSFLHQPLDAEIGLTGLTESDRDSVRLRIADAQHFERLGIVQDTFLQDLRFELERVGQAWQIRLRSSRPVAEPFLDFPLQLTWPGGQMVRHYTLLLDPPARAAPPRISSARPEVAVDLAAPAPDPADKRSSYGPVRTGETLWPIAQRVKPAGITTHQMAIALLRANPEAFIGGNINRLRAGATLAIPDLATIAVLDAQAARAEFAVQAAARAPARSPALPAASETSVQQAAPPAIPPPPLPAPDPSRDRLRIVPQMSPSEASANEEDLEQQLLATMEEIESNRMTTGLIAIRLERLEAELHRMQQLLALKDTQIAALESELAVGQQAPAAGIHGGAAQADTSTAPVAIADGAVAPGPDSAAPEAQGGTAKPPRIEALPATSPRPSSQPWYEEFLWPIWALLAIFALSALLWLFRRSHAAEEAQFSDTIDLSDVTQPLTSYAAETSRDAPDRSGPPLGRPQHGARATLAAATTGLAADRLAASGSQEVTLAADAGRDSWSEDSLDESLLHSLLGDHESVTATESALQDSPSEFRDTEIAAWVDELSDDGARSVIPDHDVSQGQIDSDDVPSILNELDSQLLAVNDSGIGAIQELDLPTVDESTQDDTFSMSLDLARAYLEIGDKEGAGDMLRQALTGTSDPGQRRQIEQLLRQIN